MCESCRRGGKPWALVYARVSTPGQEEDGSSLDTQVAECLSLARAEGFEVPGRFILREQWTGAELGRPLLGQARKAARLGEVHAFVCLSPDRLSRNPAHLMQVTEELPEHDVRLLFCQGPSGDTPEDKLLRYISGFVGQKERQAITERTTRGKIAWAGRGVMPVGSGRGLYGYELDEVAKKRRVLPDEAVVVRLIFDLCISGICVYEIARTLNLKGILTKGGGKWHPLTVKRVLINTGYKGVTYYGKERSQKIKNSTKRLRTATDPSEWVVVEGFTPPIISEAAFELAQQRLKEPKARTGKAIEPYLLSGHLLCGYCNTPMVGTTMNRKYRYYRCRATYHTATGPKQCSAPYIPYAKLEAAVWDTTIRVLEQPDVVIAEMRRLKNNKRNPIEDDVARLKREIRKCKEQESRLVRLYKFGEIDDDLIKKESAPLKLRREGYEAELEKLTSQELAMAELENMEGRAEEYCRRMRQNLDTFGFEEKRTALKALKIKALVTATDVQVRGVLGVEPDLATTAQTSA